MGFKRPPLSSLVIKGITSVLDKSPMIYQGRIACKSLMSKDILSSDFNLIS